MADPLQNTGGSSASTTALVITLLAKPQVGNTLICQVASNNSGVTSITGGGATWVADINTGTTNDIELWRGYVTGTPGTAITINTPLARIDARVTEWPGRLVPALATTNFGTGTVIDTGGGMTPNGPFQLVLAHCIIFQNISSGPTGGFQQLSSVVSGSFTMGCGALRETAVALADPTWTAAVAGGWDCVACAYQSVPYVPSFQRDEISDQVVG